MTEQVLRHNGRKIPTRIRPYYEALGVDDAVRFFLQLGGSEIFLPKNGSSDRSLAATIVGAEKVLALSEALGSGYVKVPLASRWIAEVLFMRGDSVSKIARTVRSDTATVRRWLDKPMAA